jgi:hypothetical protein
MGYCIFQHSVIYGKLYVTACNVSQQVETRSLLSFHSVCLIQYSDIHKIHTL